MIDRDKDIIAGVTLNMELPVDVTIGNVTIEAGNRVSVLLTCIAAQLDIRKEKRNDGYHV